MGKIKRGIIHITKRVNIMTTSALEYVKAQAKKEFPEHNLGVYDYFIECNEIHSKVFSSSRWWDYTKVVIEVGGVLSGVDGAETTGDDSPRDKGWVFDEETVKYVSVETKTVIVTHYPESDVPIKKG